MRRARGRRQKRLSGKQEIETLQRRDARFLRSNRYTLRSHRTPPDDPEFAFPTKSYPLTCQGHSPRFLARTR